MTPTSPAAYPPERHVLRDLDITSEQVSATRSVSAAPVDDAVRDRGGGGSLGFLAALVDVNAALVALIAAQPDWTATADLTLHATGRLAAGPALADARLVRAGSNIVVVGTDVYDAGGLDGDAALAALAGGNGMGPFARVATGLLTFARIPRRASAAESFDPASVIGARRRLSPANPASAPPAGSLHDRIGLRVTEAAGGAVELAKSDYVRNSFGAINGGVLGMVVQGAAEAALPGFAAADLHVHYLAQARVGPARTAATVLRRGADHAVVAVEVVDAGDGDQLLSLASVTLRRAGPAG